MDRDSFPHGGDALSLAKELGLPPSEILDFSASINPLGLPDWLRPVISSQISSLTRYPDPHCRELLAAAQARYGVPAGELTAGNGVSELLTGLARALPLARAVIAVPAYCDYQNACERAGLEVRQVPLREDRDFVLDTAELEASLGEPAAVFLGRPNNPTGLDLPAGDILALAKAHPQSLFIVDEAFGGLRQGFESLTDKRPENLAVLISLTKLYAIPGLRLGLMAGPRWLIRAVSRQLPDWSVNSLAQAVGVEAMADKDFQERSCREVSRLRRDLTEGLAALPGVRVYPGLANFLLCRLDEPRVRDLAGSLKAKAILIRECANFPGLDGRFFRVAVRPEEENSRLLAAMGEILAGPRPAGRTGQARAKALMVQGTSSNAGKSILTAALCRILRQDGIAVAPFKAQNMSLNSYVTAWGQEMGRAQVLQAQAAGLTPQVRMNPVLLKPCSDTGSQVIVMGRPVGNMGVGQYVAYKPKVLETVHQAYDSLAGEFQAVILEGAGSPAEVNLKHHDIVNMAMAEYAKAKVLLVGDIDRGGVFAALAGTMELLNERERGLVQGFVLNRFRGDPGLLTPALEFTRRLTGRPVLGVIPELPDLGLPEEDSVSFKARGFTSAPGRDLDIALIDLPHISNFTDLDALAGEPDVSLRVVTGPKELGAPDAVILPGSKNTLADLARLREIGLAQALLDLAGQGRVEIVGICAGFQMLGERLLDPLGLESGLGQAPGLGLLPLVTELMAAKSLTQTKAVHKTSGLSLEGYEIHHGLTRPQVPGLAPLIQDSSGRALGYGREGAWGSYLHGIFDAQDFRRWWLNRLRTAKGLVALAPGAGPDLEAALDRLALAVRQALDMGAVYAMLGL